MAIANFIGVYSNLPVTRRQSNNTPRKRYWFVWDNLRGEYIVQLLNAAYQPVEEPKTISAELFDQSYQSESTIFVTPLTKMEVPDISAQPAEDAPLQDAPKGDHDPRLVEAAKLDESLRNEFSLALSKLNRGDKTSAVSALERLVSRREGIVPAHKHAFTEFAVNLRKSSLPAVAFKFYQRVLELSPEDSNAYFNMARIMFDLGDHEGTEKHLQQALNLDADFEEAQRFLDYLMQYRQRDKAKKNNSSKDFEPIQFVK